MLVNGKDYPIYYGKLKKNVWSHQPDNMNLMTMITMITIDGMLIVNDHNKRSLMINDGIDDTNWW